MLNQLKLQTSINLAEWGIDVFFVKQQQLSVSTSSIKLYIESQAVKVTKINLLSSTIIFFFCIYDNITVFTTSLGIREKSNI